MNELIIKYAISKKMKLQALIVAIYLLLLSLGMAILEMTKSHYEVYFFIGIIGVIISLSLIISVTISQPKPLVILNNEFLTFNFPLQRLNAIINWEQVSHIGIGLSFITLVVDDKQLNVDLEILRYHDLKVLKSKLMEIAEAHNIPYNNI
ncbi:MAG: hypothetical protein PHI32_02885 [Dysgonamonadaceae bacterium]|nr:hypothetical protein [Dysgonamonadaceae bacterium]MDD4727983.1 hypothetical protein [Dysgonamonadaceae bacterium]